MSAFFEIYYHFTHKFIDEHNNCNSQICNNTIPVEAEDEKDAIEIFLKDKPHPVDRVEKIISEKDITKVVAVALIMNLPPNYNIQDGLEKRGLGKWYSGIGDRWGWSLIELEGMDLIELIELYKKVVSSWHKDSLIKF